MNIDEFRVRGKEMIEYICEYIRTLESKRVTANVDPGYLRPLLPKEAPLKPESWDAIMRDVDGKIMPGITHWQHPRFHAYFPSGNSFPSILGDLLSDAIGCIGFSWAASPACTELETIVLDCDRPAGRFPVGAEDFRRRRSDPKFGVRVHPGDDVGGATPGDQDAEGAGAEYGGLRLPAAAGGLLLHGVALVRGKGGDDQPGEAAGARAGREGGVARQTPGVGDERGRGERPGAVLRVHHLRHHRLVRLRQSRGDRAGVQALPERVASRGRRLRRQRVHLPGDAAVHGWHRARGLLQHESQQVAVGEFRLLLPVGAQSGETHVGLGRGSSVPSARALRRVGGLSSLGYPAQQALQSTEALVRVALLRHQRSAEVHQESHQAGEAIRSADEERPALRDPQRRASRSGVLPAEGERGDESGTVGEHQRQRQVAYDTGSRHGQIRPSLLRDEGRRDRRGYRLRTQRDRGTRYGSDAGALRGHRGRVQGQRTQKPRRLGQETRTEVQLHQERHQRRLQEVHLQVQPARRRDAHHGRGRQFAGRRYRRRSFPQQQVVTMSMTVPSADSGRGG